MARTKFKSITMEYAGQDLLDGGMLANVDGALSGATRYNVQAVQCLGAAAVELDENGNLEGECSVPVAVDYETEAEMVGDVLARQAFCDAHQRGVLRRGIAGAQARAVVTPILPLPAGAYDFSVKVGASYVGEWYVDITEGQVSTLGELADLLNDDGEPWSGVRPVEVSAVDGKLVLTALDAYPGADGNDVSFEFSDGYLRPWEEDDVQLSGGVDAVELAREAGLSGFEYSSTLGGGGLRVVYEYGFILGADAGV